MEEEKQDWEPRGPIQEGYTLLRLGSTSFQVIGYAKA